MKTLLIFLIFVCSAVFAGCDSEKEIFEPLLPNVEADVYSQIAREVRKHNSEGVSDLKSLIEKAEKQVTNDKVKEALEIISEQTEKNYISPVWASYLVSIAKTDVRDKIYLLYGDLSDQEISDEKESIKALLENYTQNRGYTLHYDFSVNFEKWAEILRKNDAAVIIWRSHGNLEKAPYDNISEHFMARIRTTEKIESSRSRIWAADWEALLPEGLVHVALSTCMSDGLFLEEDWSLVEGNPDFPYSDARISTFETVIGDRSLYYRGYRGPSFSPGMDKLGEIAVEYFLPDRTGEDQAPWNLVYTYIFSMFDEWRHENSPDILKMESYCRLDWFRCLFEGTEKYGPDMNYDKENGTWTLTISADTDRDFRCPIDEDVVFTLYDDGTVNHNFYDILEGYDSEKAFCSSI